MLTIAWQYLAVRKHSAGAENRRDAVDRDAPGGSDPEAIGGVGIIWPKYIIAFDLFAGEDNGNNIHRFTASLLWCAVKGDGLAHQ